MTSPHAPSHVSLPSINELFPEHLMASAPQSPYSSSAYGASHAPRYANEPNRECSAHSSRRASYSDSGYRSSTERSPTDLAQPRSLQAYAPAQPALSSADAYAHRADTHREPKSGTGQVSPHLPESYSSHARRVQVAASYSFDVLRQNPLTANLENVASSTNAAEPPRLPNASAFGYGSTANDSVVTSITKARPTFRVHLPARSGMPGMADPMRSPPFSSFENAEEPRHASAIPPSFSANSYLSAPTASGGSHGLQRLSQQPEMGHGSEEKRHRCPHCNKRFNRPSSLNIHVNTHTGAKPFICRYPGCNRRFNVNSNMRRHYRNHLTSRRRDVVARLLQPTSPSPSGFGSTSRSPEPAYDHHYPQPPSSYSSYSPDPHGMSYSDPEEYDRPAHSYGRPPPPGVKSETPEPALSMPESHLRDDRCRLRSNSSPVPRYRDERARARPGSCNVQGCACTSTSISTALRPAFPEYMPAPPADPGRRGPF